MEVRGRGEKTASSVAIGLCYLHAIGTVVYLKPPLALINKKRQEILGRLGLLYPSRVFSSGGFTTTKIRGRGIKTYPPFTAVQ